MLFFPSSYRGPGGPFIGLRSWSRPIIAIGSIAWSTAKDFPQIRGQSRVFATASWPLRQRSLWHSVMLQDPGRASRS